MNIEKSTQFINIVYEVLSSPKIVKNVSIEFWLFNNTSMSYQGMIMFGMIR